MLHVNTCNSEDWLQYTRERPIMLFVELIELRTQTVLNNVGGVLPSGKEQQ